MRRQTDRFVEAEIMLIIGVRHGVGERLYMVIAGGAGAFQRGGVVNRQAPRGQCGGVALELGVHFENGEEFLQRRLKHLRPTARLAPQNADRVKLQQSFAHRRPGQAEFRNQRLFLQHISWRQCAVLNALDDMRDDHISLIAHAQAYVFSLRL